MLRIVFLIFFVISTHIFAQSKPGKYAHLASYAGTWSVDSIYADDAILNLLTKDFRINLEKFKSIKEDSISQIDVLKGNLLLISSLKEDPCVSSTYMSISLTDDETVYLLAMRDRKLQVFHTVFGQTTRDMKNHKFNKEVALQLRKMLNQCKIKGLQNT